ncbi:MAG: T9SS type A sorting domain-containing protein [Flavobacterium sp.]
MKKIIVLILFWLINFGWSQTSGTIYQRVQGAIGQKVLDPNNDGFTSLTSAGFSGTDFGANSELKMIGLPVLATEEPHSDLSNGNNGGLTDLVSAGNNNSVYLLTKNVDGTNYLVARFRVGNIGTAGKAYAILMDTNNNLTGANYGFELEVSLQTGSQSGGVYVRDYRNASTQTFAIGSYSQRSIALTTVNNTPDYFLDFFVPISALGDISNARIAAATGNNSSSVLSSGGLTDVNGIRDTNYGGNITAMFNALTTAIPPVDVTNLTENFNANTWLMKASTPTVNGGIATNSPSISGTSQEPAGTTITVYRNGVSLGTANVLANGSWSLVSSNFSSSLQIGDLITAQVTNGVNKSESLVSSSIQVIGVQSCFTNIPNVSGYQNGQTVLSGSWSNNGIAIPANSYQVRAYIANTANNPHTYTEIFQSGNTPAYVGTDGSWTFNTQYNQSQFTSFTYFVRVVKNSCLSDYSDPFLPGNQSGIILTPAPSISPTTIFQNIGSTNIQVTNLSTTASTLYLYVNGVLVGTSPTTINSNLSHTFSVSGLIEGDVIYARAIGTTTNHRLSADSNNVIVQASNIQSNTPTINGPLAAGTSQTINGLSTEAPGTLINVFVNGTQVGTTTVDPFGNWSLSGINLTAGQTVTANAKATGKTTSANASNLTVQAAPPSAPVISNEYVAGQTNISGTGASGTVRIYVDGAQVASQTVAGAWSVTVPNDALYRGAVITARNDVGGVLSVLSNTKTVTGVGGYCITLDNGNPLPANINSGETLSVKITAITGTTCPGTPFTGFTGTVNLSSSGVISPSGATANFVGGELITAITFGGIGTTSLQILNTDDPTAIGSASLNVVMPGLWVGSIDTDFNKSGNWSNNYVPGIGANITFAGNVQNDLHLDTNRLIGDLDFNNGAHSFKLVLGDNTLEIRGNILNSSAIKSITSSDNSKLIISGYGASSPLYFSTGSTIDELTLNRTNSGAIAVGSPVRVLSILTVVNGTLTSNGNITLASSATKTAVVPAVGGNISGNVKVEKYIPNRRAFRFMTSTVNSSASINANWQEGATNPDTTGGNVNPNPGYGTHITGNGQNGLDATNTTNYSMFTYNNTNPAWEAVTNTLTNNLVAGKAYRILVRGDRSVNLNINAPTPTPTILRAEGTLVVGDFTIPAGDLNQNNQAFSFIANPYQARVNMKEVLRSTGFNQQVWYWNPRMGAAGRGAYSNVDFTGETDLVTAGPTPENTNSRIVSPFAAFFVRKQGGTSSSITFREIHKLSEISNSALFKNAPTFNEAIQQIGLSLHEVGGVLPTDNMLDGALIAFHSNFDSALTESDMIKLSNLDEDLAIYHGTNRVSIDKRNLPEVTEQIDLGITKYRYTQYQMKLNLTQYQGITPYLLDNFTNTYTELTPGTVVTYPFAIQTSNVATTSLDRFKLVFQNNPLGVTDVNTNWGVYPNPVVNQSFEIKLPLNTEDAQVKLYQLNGVEIPLQVSASTNGILQCEMSNTVAQGIYLLVVHQNGAKYTQKLILK